MLAAGCSGELGKSVRRELGVWSEGRGRVAGLCSPGKDGRSYGRAVWKWVSVKGLPDSVSESDRTGRRCVFAVTTGGFQRNWQYLVSYLVSGHAAALRHGFV